MALALFDSLAEFLGILQIGIAILIVKEIFGVLRGEGGGGGILGGGFKIPKVFGNKGDARDLLKTEGGEAVKETVEEKEAKRQRADLDRIRQLSQYGVKDAEGMKNAIGTVIGLIRRSKGRLTPEIYQEVTAELQSINQKGAEIQNATKALEGVINDLERAEYEEVNLAKSAAVNARIAAEKAKRASPGGLKKTDMGKLTNIQLAIERDAEKRAAQVWVATKKELESRKNSIKGMELEFGKLLSDAIPRINPTQYETAVQFLKKAQVMLDQIAAAFRAEGGKFVNDVKGRLAVELKDLKNEKGLITRINQQFARP